MPGVCLGLFVGFGCVCMLYVQLCACVCVWCIYSCAHVCVCMGVSVCLCSRVNEMILEWLWKQGRIWHEQC